MESWLDKISRIRMVYFRNWKDTITWLLLVSLLLWTLAKAFGWINTPKLIESYPQLGVVLLAFALFERFVTLENKFAALDNKVVGIGQDLHEFKNQMHTDLKEVRNELRLHDNRLVRIEAKAI